MSYLGKKIFILSCIGTMAFVCSSCDKFFPSKKAAEKTSVSSTTTSSSPSISTDQGPLPADVVARVGDWKLTEDEFNQRLKLLKQGLPDFNEKDPATKATVLNELIRQQLLVKDAENSDIVQQKDIKDAVEDFRRTLLVQELANRVTKGVTATEDDAKQYYDNPKNKEIFIDPVKWKIRQITVADEAAAKALLVQILQGGDFAALAQAQSKDKFAAKGGVVPEFTQAPSEDIQKAISSLDAGGTSAVFKSPEGYSIIRVDEKKGGTAKSFAEVKKDLISGLTLQKQQRAILEYIDKLSQKNKVDVNNALLGISDKK